MKSKSVSHYLSVFSMSSFAVSDCLYATRHVGYQRFAVLLCDFSDPNFLDWLSRVLNVWRCVFFVILSFMQDGAHCHPSKVATEFLKMMKNKISVLEWPGIIWDLNPIENLWTDMKIHRPWTGMSNFSLSVSNSTYLGPFIVVLCGMKYWPVAPWHPKSFSSASVSLWVQHISCRNPYPMAA